MTQRIYWVNPASGDHAHTADLGFLDEVDRMSCPGEGITIVDSNSDYDDWSIWGSDSDLFQWINTWRGPLDALDQVND